MTWKEFFSRPKYVLATLGVVTFLWLAFNPQFIEQVIIPLLGQLLAIAIMIWAIKRLIFGGKKGEVKK